MENMWESIYSALQKYSSIPGEEWDHFKSLSVHKTVTKKHHFVRAGEPADFIGFCVSGLFRLYYSTPDGNEFKQKFLYEI
ncbi:Crp/Fnr family transcriptional regulator [Paenibacillus segetis]|uniref:Cyclic nucleotide-binding domain-containing protein n=1 Tax=Paenibacillus segetis TaxID=1325360 RepID=A0ABQ1YEB6_9BACL|nr:Crp/Fnr family transcriptional regulator [Paenibacillus segetis]GGH23103.1 hypothetical protein GCM10008013_21950 [Paenibacillus segetis]